MKAESHRLAALCFADIAGYTELSATNEGAAVALVRLFQEVARGAIEERGGRVVKFIGDAVLAEFASTDAAVRSALELRDRFAADARRRGMGSRDVRLGVHVGDIVSSPDGDVYGDGVNVASRVQAAAEPGAVWVSEDVWRQLRQRPEFRFESRGQHELKGLAAPVALHAVTLAATGREAEVPPAGAPIGGSVGHEESVAVLPFTNMSASEENEYFSDGITEEILMVLSKVQALKVISRTSVMRFKGTNLGVAQIGKELGVAHVVEGSVRRAGNRVRITAQLIDARTDRHVWAEAYDRDLDDIFAIQADVAERIVEALKVRLTPKEQARLGERPTENVQAYQWYLKGRHFLSRRTPSALHQAVERFGKAVEADPEFAQAWAGLADAYALLPTYSSSAPPEANAKAREAAARALALDPRLGESHAALGLVAQNEWRWAEAEAELRRAIELTPGYATAYHWYGILLVRLRPAEAPAVLQQALELDPVSLPIHAAMGVALMRLGRSEEAIAIYRKGMELDPAHPSVHLNLAGVYASLGRYEESLAELKILSRLGHESYPPDLVAELLRGYESGGPPGLYEAALEGLRARPGLRARTYDMAAACAKLGRADEAFGLLDELLDQRSPVVTQIEADPDFGSLRSDPRYQRVLEKLGLRQLPR